jgi:hypothetical protein
MLEIILFIVSILFTIKMLNEAAGNPTDPEYQLEPSTLEIEEVEDSKGNLVYLVYYNGDFLMQDYDRAQLDVRLNNWLNEQGARVVEPDTREAVKRF